MDVPSEWQGVVILSRLIPCSQHFVEPKDRPKKSWHHRQAELNALRSTNYLEKPAALKLPEDTPAEASELMSPFEASMSELAESLAISPLKRSSFTHYLLENPCNVALRASHMYGRPTAADWPAALAAALTKSTSSATRQISWELLLCLMRNILCHEHCFEFRCISDLFVTCSWLQQREEHVDRSIAMLWICCSD